MVSALSLMRVEVSRFGAFICLIGGSSKLVRWPFVFSALSSSHCFPDQMELWNIFSGGVSSRLSGKTQLWKGKNRWLVDYWGSRRKNVVKFERSEWILVEIGLDVYVFSKVLRFKILKDATYGKEILFPISCGEKTYWCFRKPAVGCDVSILATDVWLLS